MNINGIFNFKQPHLPLQILLMLNYTIYVTKHSQTSKRLYRRKTSTQKDTTYKNINYNEYNRRILRRNSIHNLIWKCDYNSNKITKIYTRNFMCKNLRYPTNPDTRYFVLYIILGFFTFLFLLQSLPDNDYLSRNMLQHYCGELFINNNKLYLKA